jgi:hypothetical protein
MIDRLSILALKLFHTREEMERPDAPEGHAERNGERLAILLEQRERSGGLPGAALGRDRLPGPGDSSFTGS